MQRIRCVLPHFFVTSYEFKVGRRERNTLDESISGTPPESHISDPMIQYNKIKKTGHSVAWSG